MLDLILPGPTFIIPMEELLHNPYTPGCVASPMRISTRVMPQQEIWEVQRAWRTIFARKLYRQTGRWARGADADRALFHPNAMSFYLTGAEAEAEYAAAEATRVYIIDDSGKYGEVRECVGGRKPELAEFSESRGVIISPEGFDWTVAVGPEYYDRVCFTRHEWVDDDGSSSQS